MPTTAPSFTILPPKKPPQLDAQRRAQCQVVVTNNGRLPIEGRVRVVAKDPAKSEWITLVDSAATVTTAKPDSGERTWKVQEQQVFTVAVAIPADAPAGNYRFHIEAYAVQAPEDDCAESAPIDVTVAGAAPAAKKPFPIWIPIVAGAAVLAIAGGVLALVLMRSPKPPTALPSLAGMTVEEATKLLADNGFTAGKVEQAEDPTQAAGTILSQQPAANEPAAKGSAVDVVVATAPAPVSVVAVVGKPLDQAIAELGPKVKAEKAGETRTGKHPAGTVVTQEPAAGASIAPGSRVLLVVEASALVVAIHVPQLSGLAQSEAERVLVSLGMRGVVKDTRFVPGRNDGEVLEQQPAPGTYDHEVREVAMVVQSPSAIVPNLNRQPLASARATLEQLGLGAIEISTSETLPTIPAGAVVGQLERAGLRVERGHKVTITVNRSPVIVHIDPRIMIDRHAVLEQPVLRKQIEPEPPPRKSIQMDRVRRFDQ